MTSRSVRRPLTLGAVLAGSVSAVAAVVPTAAHATTYGMPAPASPVTVTVDNKVHVVGGGVVSLPAGARDVSWSGNGSRMAFIGADGGVYTADADGSHIMPIASANLVDVGMREHTVWSADSRFVIWSETWIGRSTLPTLVQAPSDGSYAALQRLPEPVVDDAALTAAGLPNDVGMSDPDVAADGSIVFQTSRQYQSPSPVGVAVITWNGTTPKVTQVLPIPAEASTLETPRHPSISPDGKTVVFTKQLNFNELFTTTRQADGTWSAPQQVTFDQYGGLDKIDHTRPVFEPDGKTVAFSRSDMTHPETPVKGTYTVDITAMVPPKISVNTPTNAETKISDDFGDLAVRTDAKTAVMRIAGTDRTDTAIRASKQLWATAGAANDKRAAAGSVTLSRSDLFADALGGAGLAAHKNGPLLLTETKTLSSGTRDEIQRVLKPGGTVYLLGGPAAISDGVLHALAGLGYHPVRVSGADRYETAVKIAQAVSPNPSEILVATGVNYPDALSAGAVAASFDQAVVVLTDDTAMPKPTAAYLNGFALGKGTGVVAVGGQAKQAIMTGKWTKQSFSFAALAGKDRFQTSYMVARDFFGGAGSVGLATGMAWPDALSGSAFLGRTYGPLLLLDPAAGLSADDSGFIHDNRGSLELGVVFGGYGALPPAIDGQLAVAIGGPAGTVTIPASAAPRAVVGRVPSNTSVAP
ncbi:cell wall-binding repeat-containing protein [Catenulispora subtropica]|uniref:Cell wall binding repeat 2-containing protein n=1 Tax=Catenulispora subtropica TaxID=450798 RepID=A0ABP5BQ93_9ACTN